jgi:hypothetical protein
MLEFNRVGPRLQQTAMHGAGPVVLMFQIGVRFGSPDLWRLSCSAFLPADAKVFLLIPYLRG